MYAPSDDSYLILDYFKRNISKTNFDGIKIHDVKNVLDMGTGSGILAIFLQLVKQINPSFNAKIYASDIDQDAIISAKKNEKSNNFSNEITYIHSDLFNSFPPKLKGKFDIIIYNPPYLPSLRKEKGMDYKKKEFAWDGGKEGVETFLDFLYEAKEFLNKQNKFYIYYICSSRSNLKILSQNIIRMGFKNKTLTNKHIFFEDILLNRLE